MDLTDHETALRRLAAAEESVVQAHARVVRQRAILAEIERAGHDPAQARALLATFESVQANHEQRLATLLRELSQCGWDLSGP